MQPSESIACGKYLLEREIARGGMGTIWVALDPHLRRRVAIKRINADRVSSPEAAERFEREALSIARLAHPHVVQVFDYGMDGGAPYIVMELLDGEDLAARVERFHRLPLAALVPIIGQTAKALAAAHAAGVVHRDVKPANIFLSRSGPDEIVKVLDFGVAAAQLDPLRADGRGLVTGALMGTPAYMSPEQARSRGVDHRSDLWSLGVVAYQALTGHLPFPAKGLGDQVVAICSDPIPSPSTLVPGLEARVDAFFERALSRNPEGRFSSATDMAAAFAALADPQGVERAAKILVVDDEPDVRYMVEHYFKRKIERGVHSFLFARDGEDALSTLRLHPDVDLILTDIRMPRMDGLTFLDRAAELSPLAKVVMVSAYGDIGNVRKAMNSGAFDFLLKPIDLEDLERTIDKTLAHVKELRRTTRSMEENGLLRMFVHRGILARFLPTIRVGGVISSEAVSATVAFLDVCGSGEIAGQTMAGELAAINASFEVIVPEILARDGIVDKFVGNTVMAVFLGDHHAVRAVAAAEAARAELSRLAALDAEGSPYGLGVRVGIESGTLLSGAVGSHALRHLDYTVLGRAVSVASDLEHIAEKGQILGGESLRAELGDEAECVAFDGAMRPAGRPPVPAYRIALRAPAKEGTGSSTRTTVVLESGTTKSIA